MSIVATYALNKKLDLSATWVHNTGTRLTAPTGRFNYGGELIPVYSDRNASKMPDYHRADVGLNWKISDDDKRWKNSLNFSIYNVYARQNAFAINFVNNEVNLPTARMTYLFSIIPSITWNFEF